MEFVCCFWMYISIYQNNNNMVQFNNNNNNNNNNNSNCITTKILIDYHSYK